MASVGVQGGKVRAFFAHLVGDVLKVWACASITAVELDPAVVTGVADLIFVDFRTLGGLVVAIHYLIPLFIKCRIVVSGSIWILRCVGEVLLQLWNSGVLRELGAVAVKEGALIRDSDVGLS